MSTCPRCRAPFECGAVEGKPGEPCWCMRLPPLRATACKDDKSREIAPMACLCPQCLQTLLAAQASRKDVRR